MKFQTSSQKCFFCITAILALLFFGCASKSDIKEPSSQSSIQAESGDVTESQLEPSSSSAFSVSAIEILDEEDGCRVKIDTPSTPQYTIFKLSNPERIIVDIPDMELDEDPDSVEIENDLISTLTGTR